MAKEPDIFEDICKMVLGTSILSDLRCHKGEVRRILEAMPLDQYPEEKVKNFQSYVFDNTEETGKALEEREQMLKKVLLDLGIHTRL